MLAKMTAIEKNGTWRLAKLPPECHAIGLKWVFKVKRDEGVKLSSIKLAWW
jgi:hypothetical protein